jgi:hypothetical protein
MNVVAKQGVESVASRSSQVDAADLATVTSSYLIEDVQSFSRESHHDGLEAQRPLPTLFLFHAGKTYPNLERWARALPSQSLRLAILKLGDFLEFRRYPRSWEYMNALMSRHVSSAHSTVAKPFDADMSVASLPQVDWQRVRQILLLWPDANGTGWSMIERWVFQHKALETRVYVLNGRGRLFELTGSIWRRWRIKRFLEKSFLAEMGFLLVFLMTSPFLSLWDAIRRRRS